MAGRLEAVPSTRTVEKQREISEVDAARELVRMAREQGLALTGPDGLLKLLTKTVIETALDEELTEHLGYERHDAAAKVTANSRNGTRPKTVLTETTGPVEIDVPRDREGTFEPKIVAKRQRRLTGVDEMVLSLYAKGLTTGEISAHFAEIYGASVSKEPVSRITDRVLEEMASWQNRPLDEVYAAIFIDAIVVKVRDRQVANRPVYAAIGVTLAGEKDILGLWAGTGGEGAKFWMSVLTDIKNRGVKDSFFLVCDGLKGLPEVVGNVWPLTTVQTCIIHLIRNTFRLASKQDWDALKRDVKPIYTAVNATAARAAFEELTERWGRKYGAIDRAALGKRLGGVHPVPGLRRGNPARDLLDQRDRIPEREVPACREGPGSFPDRAGRAKVPVSGHPIPRSDRCRQDPMDNALEARFERLRHHLQQPIPSR
jgi:putative transposase